MRSKRSLWFTARHPARVLGFTRKHGGRLAQLTRLREGHAQNREGLSIYYRSIGLGFPLVLCNGMGVSTFFWKYFEQSFKHEFQVVTWDYRGHGRSSFPDHAQNVSVPALVEDCTAVLDELGIRQAFFIGHSMGVQVILELYRRQPQRVAGLASCFGTFGRPMDYFFNSSWSRYAFDLLAHVGVQFPRLSNVASQLLMRNPLWYQLGGLLKMINTGMASKADAQEYIDHLLSRDPRFFVALSRSAQAHTAEDVLKTIGVPALVIGGEYDTFTPVWLAKKMHRLMPGSELFIVKKGSHAAIVEQPELINLRIEKFLGERVLPSEPVCGQG